MKRRTRKVMRIALAIITVLTLQQGIFAETPKGSEVVIYVGTEEEPEKVTVPDFVGLTEEEANEQAAEVGLLVTFTEKEGTEDIGKIISQSIAKNSEVERDTRIKLTIVVASEDKPDVPDTTPNPDSDEVSTQNFTIDLPQNKEQATVVIKRDGTEIYKGTHDTSAKRVTVPVKGKGTQKIEITVDGQLYFSQNVKFN